MLAIKPLAYGKEGVTVCNKPRPLQVQAAARELIALTKVKTAVLLRSGPTPNARWPIETSTWKAGPGFGMEKPPACIPRTSTNSLVANPVDRTRVSSKLPFLSSKTALRHASLRNTIDFTLPPSSSPLFSRYKRPVGLSHLRFAGPSRPPE
jgi:hypothetical protein